nr:unnamed protein product [Callosobruchus analis]
MLSGLSSFRALDMHVQRRFPKVAPTGWNYNRRLVQLFQDIWTNKEKWDAETVTAAKEYLHEFQQGFDFNYFTKYFFRYFPYTDIFFDVLQI